MLRRSGIALRARESRRDCKTQLRRALVPTSCLLMLFGAVLVSISFTAAEERRTNTVERFKQLYGNVRDYNSIKLTTLNGQRYILAFWNEDNDPLQLWVNIFAYSDDELQAPVYKAFSGDVSEDVIDIAQRPLTDGSRRDLVFLCKSGQIEMVRVLRQKGRELQLVFENGGSDITLPTDQREIWIKSRSSKEMNIYKWDQTLGKFVDSRTMPVAF
jgi:hypothetical protein